MLSPNRHSWRRVVQVTSSFTWNRDAVRPCGHKPSRPPTALNGTLGPWPCRTIGKAANVALRFDGAKILEYQENDGLNEFTRWLLTIWVNPDTIEYSGWGDDA